MFELCVRESLDILLDNFYQSVDRLTDQALQGAIDHGQMQMFSQSVKAVCAILAKIETISITKALDRLERVVSEMAVSLCVCVCECGYVCIHVYNI